MERLDLLGIGAELTQLLLLDLESSFRFHEFHLELPEGFVDPQDLVVVPAFAFLFILKLQFDQFYFVLVNQMLNFFLVLPFDALVLLLQLRQLVTDLFLDPSPARTATRSPGRMGRVLVVRKLWRLLQRPCSRLLRVCRSGRGKELIFGEFRLLL
jgi:hypothetical protein